MSETNDRKLGMDRSITRRDFLNGVAIGTGGAVAGAMISGFSWEAFGASAAAQGQPGYYPPALTGLRGSHVGSFEAAHGVRDGKFPAKGLAPADTKELYDLVIVGGGISGLAAAYFWRAKSPGARILILDNHDDFGGHAKRNELRANGRMLLANGGTWAIESPFPYSKIARGLMDDLGIATASVSSRKISCRTSADIGVFHRKASHSWPLPPPDLLPGKFVTKRSAPNVCLSKNTPPPRVL
jgi:spermidine dehydrogenase